MTQHAIPCVELSRLAILVSLAVAGPVATCVHGQTGTLFWTEPGQVQAANTQGQRVRTVAPGHQAHALDADATTRQVFFANATTDDITRVNFDGTGRTTILSGLGGSSYQGLAVDPVRGKVWWSDWNTGDIKNANYDGTGAQTVFTITGPPAGLDIDPVSGKIYVAAGRSVYQADLSGANHTTLHTDPSAYILDVAVDASNKGVYWTDAYQHKVQRYDLTGANVKDVITNGLSTPIGVDVLPSLGEVYIANKGGGFIVSASLSGQHARVAYSSPSNQTWGLGAIVPAPGGAALVATGLVLWARCRR